MPPATTTSSTTTTIPVDESYEWQAGDCFEFGDDNDLSLLPYAPYGNGFLVDCEMSHTHEVYFVDRFSDGLGAPFEAGAVADAVRRSCAESFPGYFGIREPDSFFDTVLYLPDAEEWAAGERYQACMVYVGGLFGTFDRVSGSFRDAGDVAAWQATTGSCLLADFGALRGAVPLPCEGPHSLEIVGDVQLDAAPDAEFPGLDQLQEDAEAVCLDALAEFADDPFVGLPLAVFPMIFGEVDWEAGYRRVRCIAFASDQSGSLLEVIGSFAEPGWEPIGVFGAGTISA